MRITKTLATAVVVLAVLNAAPANATEASGATISAVNPPLTIIAVTGTNGQLYSKKSNEGFRNLGGVVRDAPAVAHSSLTGRTYYVVKSSNSALYVRTDVTGFTKIGGVCLYSPAVGVFENRFVVACIGTNHGLYYASGTLGAGNPVVSGWVYQGGYVTQGPAVFFLGTTTPHFSVVGRDAFPGYAGLNVYSRSAADPPSGYRLMYLSCLGQPDIIGAPSSYDGYSFFGCRNGGAFVGSPGQLYYEWDGSYGSAEYQADGVIAGRVGIASAADNSAAVVYVTGTNGNIYSKQLTSDYDTQPSGYTLVGCCALPGVAAATLN